MGLDITAYSNVEFIGRHKPSREFEWESMYENSQKWVSSIDAFKTAFEGLKKGAYSTLNSEKIAFNAGSYSGYNRFREILSHFGMQETPSEVWNNPERFKGGPFYDMVNFSDCEGFIGPVASTRLANDFESHWIDWTLMHSSDSFEDEYNRRKYEDWMKAYKLASNNGFVDFH